MRLDQSFFDGSTLELAERLIGCTLCYRSPQGVMAGLINETEAYTEDDPACHAFGGKMSPRNETMFKEAGHLYIYLIYGMYHCANIVTEEAGTGSAVLIRSIIPTHGIELMAENRNSSGKKLKGLCDGPGKLCQALGWDKSLDATDTLHKDSPVTLHGAENVPKGIITTSRIGISKGQDLPWRFLWDGSFQ